MTYCRKCGAKLEEDAKFCSKCGTPVALQAVERRETIRQARKPISPLAIAGIATLVIIIVVGLIAGALILAGIFPVGRVVGSGNVQMQERSFSNFSTVDVNSGFKVQISQAASYRISITTDSNVLNYVQVFETGSTLTIRLQPGIGFQTTVLKAEITMPDLQVLRFAGGVNGTAEGFVLQHDFRVELSGGSSFEMEGRANNLVALCSGGSSLTLSSFPVTNADIQFSGGSQGTISLSGILNANLSGGSRLYYIGNPTFGTINTSGGSTISRK